MKAVFNCRKKIGTLEQDYSSGCVEWPVERPGMSLRTAKEAIFYVQRRTQLANRLPITEPPRVVVLSLTGEPPHKTRGCSLGQDPNLE